MPPRIRSRGLADLGRALDERNTQPTNKLVIRQDLGTAMPTSLSGAGMGGGSSAPAMPEQVVESLQGQGEATALSGAITLAAGGELNLSQSASAPHFTISSPEYAAGDGLARTGDEFSCDGSVLRTTGNQSVGGVKTFVQFPITPTALPTADYETANKLYVDQQAGPVVLRVPGSTFAPTPVTVINPDVSTAERPFFAATWPLGASFAAVSASSRLVAGFSPPEFGLSCGHFNWTSQADGYGGISAGAAIGLGFPLAKTQYGGGVASARAIVRARVHVNSPVRFSAVYLVLNDVTEASALPVNHASANVLGSLSSGQWVEVVLAAMGTDISAWGNQLRAGLIATGAETEAQAGIAGLSMEWLQVELWRS